MKILFHFFSINILFFFLLSGCGKDNLPEFNHLEGLRVLAFKLSAPEVSPGDTVTVTPIISDIRATSLTYTARVCLDPGVSYGATPSCVGNVSAVTLADQQTLTLPGANENWTGLADSLTVQIPASAVIFEGRSSIEQFNGVSYLLEYILSNDLGETVRSIKRIVVSDSAKTSKNSNPITADILANGVSMTSLSWSSPVNLTTDLSLTSAETYSSKNSSGELGTAVEQLVTTWFVTDGETKYYRSEGLEADEYTAPSAAPVGRSVYILAITHDDRGGVSLVKKKF